VDRRHYTSAKNGVGNKGNPSPLFGHLYNQPGQPRGHHTAAVRRFLEWAYDQGATMSPSETPALDYCRSVALDPAVPAGLRLGAAAIVVRFEAHPKAPRPFVPRPPAGYTLPPLDSTANCQQALAQLAADQLTGAIDMDAAERLRKHIEVLMASLQTSEIEARLTEFAALVEQVEASRHLTSCRTPDHMSRHLRQIQELIKRFRAAHVAELRTPIHISGGIVGLPDRAVFIDRFVIHNGLPETPDYVVSDDETSLSDDCATIDAIA
jgi:hypothetical protein